jgi:group I intron endonuclease
MYKRARKEVLRNMEKTKKLPKPETLAKYDIKDEEIKEVMKPTGIIYKITSPSGKVYVGQTIRSFEKRMQEHKSKFSGCTYLKRAIQKYGDEMKYEIIEEDVPQQHIDEREIYWINHFNSLAPHGYNLGTGGHYERGYTQEAKDNMRNATIKSKIEKNGYLGRVEKDGNLFYPKAQNNCTKIFLSNGGFRTKEECIEVLKEYTKDPDNFIKVDSPYKRKDGSVLKRCEKWTVKYKNVYLGDYETEAKGWEVIEMYQRDPEKFVKPERITTGHIFKRCNRWNLRYKGNFLGSYDTQKEAQEALGRYREDPKKFIKGQRKYNGTIFKSGDKWRFRYKKKHIGSLPHPRRSRRGSTSPSKIIIRIFFGYRLYQTHNWLRFLLLTRLLLFGFGQFIQMFPKIENLIPKFLHDWEICFPPFTISLYIDNLKLLRFRPIRLCRLIFNEVRFF